MFYPCFKKKSKNNFFLNFVSILNTNKLFIKYDSQKSKKSLYYSSQSSSPILSQSIRIQHRYPFFYDKATPTPPGIKKTYKISTFLKIAQSISLQVCVNLGVYTREYRKNTCLLRMVCFSLYMIFILIDFSPPHCSFKTLVSDLSVMANSTC
jgi:hypothetical protein